MESDMERVQATLKQLVRDWSVDGLKVSMTKKQPKHAGNC